MPKQKITSFVTLLFLSLNLFLPFFHQTAYADIGDVGHWRDSVGSQIPGTTFGGFNFNQEVRNDGIYTKPNDSTVEVSEAGDYLVIATTHDDSDTNDRYNSQLTVQQIAGTGDVFSSYYTGFSRNTTEDESWTRAISIVVGASANSQFQVQKRRDVDDLTGGSVVNNSDLQVIRLTQTNYGIYGIGGDGNAYGGTTPNTVSVDSIVNESDTSAIEGNTTTDTITLKGDNKKYLIAWSTSFDDGSSVRTQRVGQLEYDGIDKLSTRAYCYGRDADNEYCGLGSLDIVETSTADIAVQTEIYRGDGIAVNQGGADSDGANITDGNGQMIVLEMPEYLEAFSSQDSVGLQDLTTAQTLNIAQDVNIADTQSFTKSTNTSVAVTNPADVFSWANIYAARGDITSRTRQTSYGSITLGGVEQTIGRHGSYSRGEQATTDSFGMGFQPAGIFSTLTSGTTLGVNTDPIAGGGGGGADQTQPNTLGFFALNLDTLVAPELDQAAYRWFENDNSSDVGTALAAQDIAANLLSDGADFRLRSLVSVSQNQLRQNEGNFKLQFAEKVGICDILFAGETYTDVTATSVIAFNNNAAPTDNDSLTTNVNDPINGATVVSQSYQELNNFTTSVAAVPEDKDAMWDFSLIDNTAPNDTSYCFRIVESDGTIFNTYSVIPEINTFGNSIPTDITLSNDTINENVAASHTIGVFTSTDINTGDIHTYSLIAGTGDSDNSAFTILGNSLRINASPDFETQSTYSIRVETNDGNGGTYEKSFTITINDIDDAPVITGGNIITTLSTDTDGDGQGDTDDVIQVVWNSSADGNNQPDSPRGALFDGVNDGVNFGDNPDLKPAGDFSVGIWATPKSLPSQWAGMVSSIPSWGTGYGLQMGSAQGIAAMTSGVYLRANITPVIGEEYYVVLTHTETGELNKIYVNGVLQNSASRNITYVANTPVTLGSFYTTPSLRFDGDMSDFQLYDKELTAAEISGIYASRGIAGSNLVTRNLLNETDGTSVADNTGNGNTGTAQNITESTFWYDNVTGVTTDLSEFGGGSIVTMYDDGTSGGDVTAGDNIWTSQYTILSGHPIGAKFASATVTDSESDTATTLDDNSVILSDEIPPVITLTGANPVSIIRNAAYTDAGATCVDNIDISCVITSTGVVDTSAIGAYTLTYNAIDSASNSAIPVTRTVNVVPGDTPILSLVGAAIINQEAGGIYTDSGSTANDTEDGNITLSVTSSGVVDTSTTGAYELTYNVTDSSGNAAIPVTRTVNIVDTTSPVITLNGASVINLVQGQSYSELGATCVDNYDTTCTPILTGAVDTTRVGSYVVSFNVTDTNLNVATTVTRTVNITPAAILINEVEYDTAGNEGESEWFEIYNPTSGIVNLENWTITEKVGTSSSKTYTFGDLGIPAGGYILVTNQTLDFQALYPGITPDLDLPGSTYFALKNTPSDELLLKDPNGVDIDFVAWENTTLGWNIAGTNASICRLSVPDTDTVADWTSSCTQTPQAENSFNATPTDITLSNSSIAENNTASATIGTFTTTDTDTGDTHTYSLVSGAGDTDNASFTVSGNNLTITPVADYETKISYSIRVATNDGKGGIFEKDFIINITNENLAPTDIVLSNNALDENNTISDVIGTLTGSDDGENNNTLTYALACTTPGVDDASFTISGTNLEAGAVYDYEVQNTFNICIQISDGVLTYDENFTITINDLDEIDPVVTITSGVKLQNSAITDTTVVITDNVGVNLSDVSATGGTLSCTQTSATQVDCTSNIPVSGNLIVNALDTSNNSGSATENNYIVDVIPPSIPNVSVDTTGSYSIDSPNVTFSSLDNVAVDYYTITYYLDDGGVGSGTLTTINPATSPIVLNLDSDETVHTIVITAYDLAGNSSTSTIKFPPIVTINAPTTLSNTPITDSTVTITAPTGNDLTNILLVTATTGASLGTCIGNGGDTTDPYATPVVCDIDGITDSGSISILAEDAGNGAEGLNSQSYIIDTTPPVITITSPTKLDNVSITDTTITVIDETALTTANVVIDGTTTLSSSAFSCTQINPSQVNCTISVDSSGDLVISATDNAGNNDLENEDTYIIDTTPPVLSLVGNNPETVEYLASYSDAGADFSDNVDGTGSVVGVGTVNTGILGSYPINYNYTDTAGNPATQVSRTVEVVDTTPPVISIIGNTVEIVEVNTTYTDNGASALDNYDGDISLSITATDNIDLTNTGSYLVNYDVVDTHSNPGITVSRTVNVVDTTAPEITLVGLDEIVLEVGSAYSELGATVSDNYETLAAGNIIIDSSAVNTSVLGTYNVTYNISDSSGNPAIEVIREVTIQDTTIPVITLVGGNPETVEVHSIYNDGGATASDNYDGNITSSISSVDGVNTTLLGSYTVTYDVIDSSSNSAIQAVRTVEVEDTTDPVITLIGSGTITQEVGTSYTDVGSTVSDNYDVIGNVTASGTVDTNTVGTYILTYNHDDSSGNSATQVIRTVIIEDTTDPVISLNGVNPVTVVVGYSYTEQSATCLDNYDTSCSVTTSGTVNTSATGSAIIIYAAIDAAGNNSSLTRTVNVVAGDNPVITLNGASSITQEVGSTYADLGAEFSDTEDGTGSIVGSGTVNINTVGVYTITYDHIDISGNPATQVTRTINIEDTTDPIITLNGSNTIVQEVGTTYTDAGAVMNDNYDATANLTAGGTVNSNVLGVYTLTYDYTDANGNVADQVTRTVVIADTTDPVISLNGSSNITQEVGTAYTDLGAEFSDNVDGSGSVVASGIVDVNSLGSYTLTYDYIDSSGNTAIQVMRTVNIVDTTNPVVSLNGVTPESLFVNETFTDAGASWSDNVDGSGSILTASSGIVDNTTVGQYLLDYTYVDSSSNTHTITRTVNVVSGDTPIITMNGLDITQEVGSVYTDLGAEFSDTEDGTGSVVGNGTVDINTLGDYDITYNYTDNSGNVATQVTRTVTIVDSTDPILSLTGNASITQEFGSSYIDGGATWTDNYDGAGALVGSGTVNTNALGSYTLTYDYIDSSGNIGNKVTRTVTIEDTTKPVVTLIGSSSESVFVNETFIDSGASWADNVDGNGSIQAATSGNVDITTVGTYTTDYTYTDSSGNFYTVTRTVNVVPGDTPIISLNGNSVITQEVDLIYTDLGAEYSDNEDGTGPLVASGNVNINTIGIYDLTYDYTDFSGNIANQVTRIVNIIDTTDPVVTLNGNAVQEYYLGVPYIEQGSTCSDNYDATCNVVITSTLNTNLLGTHIVTYTVTDSSGNTSSVTRTISVIREPRGGSSVGGINHMDVCNETQGDKSGDYYDGKCLKDEVIVEEENVQEEIEEVPVKEIVVISTEEEVLFEDKKPIVKEYKFEKNINGEVKKYVLHDEFKSCEIIDNLLSENYIDGFSTQLNDIGNSDQKDLIERLEKAGVIDGTISSIYEGEREISRVEFLKFVLRSHCIEYRNEDASFLEFRDLDNSTWQAKVVKKSVDLGIANGDQDEVGNKIFRADEIISSIEATKILLRMALVQNGEEPNSEYNDLDVDWYNKYVKQGEHLGVFNPEEDNYTFNPNDGINRNKTVEFLYKVIRLYR